jgi:hypothetical protein
MKKGNQEFILLILITLLGFALRFSFFVGNSTPLHDGGLFYVMVKDLIKNGFLPPYYSTYNHANIPFVYPPFGLYLIGIIQKLSGADLLVLFRVIPLVLSTLTIPLFYLLGLEISQKKWIALAGTSVFSILPFSYTWLILGGGVTRSMGAVFGLLALYFSIRFFRLKKVSPGIWGSLFCGLTVLSHPEWAWFVLYSLGLYILIKLFQRSWAILFQALVLLMGTFLVASPWLVTILMRFGITAFLPLVDSGFSRWGDIFQFLLLSWSGEPFFPLATLLAIVGMIWALMKKEWFLVLWLPVVFLLQGRAADQKAVVPLGLLAGIGIVTILTYTSKHFPRKAHQHITALIGILVFIYFLAGSMILGSEFIKPLPEAVMESAAWLKQSSTSDSKFLVLTSSDWPADKYSEWVSALSERESVSVIQGYEWLPGFSERILLYQNLQGAYNQGMSDLIKVFEEEQIQPNYLILPKSLAENINNLDSCAGSHWDDARMYPGVALAFENEHVLILDITGVVQP